MSRYPRDIGGDVLHAMRVSLAEAGYPDAKVDRDDHGVASVVFSPKTEEFARAVHTAYSLWSLRHGRECPSFDEWWADVERARFSSRVWREQRDQDRGSAA